ncbi:Phenolphthiocerol synthesis polyketide synthase type I Pks15/1 [Roseivivax sp. THAF40]|uniref:type I polyketide synthase n=1 Tax=unclassified Roseivivax TaxID=2639302 RepID=UPI0012AA14BA|nr:MULTISPECIES: type I polyketide synthase [unclassified Roseivivax]QFS84165.1 Phenolphthiocerol synthesis polyketide synthase type I Pks15/1 [Roseivivax sp. THAF197b]QFT47993.1 Phenolphthiocerol synthesis polyketide synthase type I Pks15/1 [Roseivivax sp. THAF40]
MTRTPATDRDIAIIGMAGMFPGSDDIHRFWANICGKLDFVGAPPPEWEAERYLNGQGPTHIPTARGGYLGEAFAADPAELGVMPTSVDGSEPDQFLALKIARAALADSGYLDGDHERTGVIVGHSTYLHRGNAAVVQHGVVLDQTRELLGQLMPWADAATLDRVRAEMAKQLPPFNADIAPGLVPNVMSGRIANRLNLNGPNYILDAACSSSILAVLSAMEELRHGRSDLMLAGGVNASISAEVYMVFNQLGALSGNGHVRPFSEGGDGTLLGEGLGLLALKRRADAERDGDRIYAILKGAGQSSDGKGSGLLAPRLEGEALAIRRAIEDAGTEATPPGLIEAHGTGIPLGDQTEIGALQTIFGNRDASGLPTTAIGSVKSMIGHCIPAAGAAGLIKTALALYHKTLPPTLSDKLRDGLGVEETPIYVNTEARPWISAPDTPRRAAVNAFGFGGVNSHAVLEEAALDAARPAGATPAHWPQELILLAAESPAHLAETAQHLADRIATHVDADLSQVAAYLAEHRGTGPARLALVAESRDDLIEKLGKAADRLAKGKGSFRIKSGIIASDTPVTGKMAFIFPGEGAQYQGMLSEILTAFPEARSWFDFWDGLFPDRETPPSASVFPPPTTLSGPLEAALADKLFGLEFGSESMFIAAQALLGVTDRVGLAPDLVVGHSSGEHSALAAAGVFGATRTAEDRAEFASRIRSLNRLYQEIEASGGIGGGALLTVGGVPRERILALTEADPDVHLALDNCEHQAVLYGSRTRMEEVAEELRPEGGMTAFLPFDRPYHTPLFADVAEKVQGVYADMAFTAPHLPVYSCATAAPMPEAPAEIRALAAHQWASRVRFTETVERLYEDGVRLFVEIGPSSNLTGFVDDTLKGRDAQAIALDSRRRGGLSHLLQALGRIWCAGREVDATALYSDRGLEAVDLAAEPKKRRARHIDNTLPVMRLPAEVAEEVAADIAQAFGRDTGAAMPPVVPQPAQTQPVQTQAALPTPADPQPSVVPSAAQASVMQDVPQDVLHGHFDLMQRFLDTAGNVAAVAMGEAQAPGLAAAEPAASEWYPPLLHRIDYGEDTLVAESDFDPLGDPFIAHHTFYADMVSDTDPELQSLPVLPLAVSLEMVLEAAAALTGQVPTRLENVRARDWVAFDDGPATLTTEAVRTGDRVAVRLLRDGGLLFEAEAVLSAGDLPPPLANLAHPQPPIWSDDALYTTGMFHGPLFQGIAALTCWDAGGLDAELHDLPLDGFFGYGEAPDGLLINPALLDQVGHVTAFWIAQGWGTDFSSFPSGIARIDLPGARAEAVAGGSVKGRLGFRDGDDRPVGDPAYARFLEGDFDCLGPDGTRLLSVRGWRDRFFDVPHRFYEARYRPREAWYGHDARALFDGAPGDVTIWSVPPFPQGFLDDAGGIWTRVLAATILSGAERAVFAGFTGKRRRDWIMGRIALKEAARAHILASHGLALLPADIEIAADEAGRPYVLPDRPALMGVTGPMPEVTLSHAGGAALAAAGPAGRRLGVDMETPEGIAPDLLSEGAFSSEELSRLGLTGTPDAAALPALLRGWCAKEAAAKMLGEGLTGRPRAFVLSAIDESAAQARVTVPSGGTVSVLLGQEGNCILALALE